MQCSDNPEDLCFLSVRGKDHFFEDSHPHGAQTLTFSSTSLRSCSHSRLSGFTRFCVKSRVSLSDSP